MFPFEMPQTILFYALNKAKTKASLICLEFYAYF
jgi:hypothetical protein